jgi:hypothetical protein
VVERVSTVPGMADGFVESLLEAPVGVGLLAALEGADRGDVVWSTDMPRGTARATVDAAVAAVSAMTWGRFLCAAVETALSRVGPWMSDAPANLAAAYRDAAARRPIAEAIAARFGPALHAPLDARVQQWWHSGSPEVEWFLRPRFRRLDEVYGAGQFTFGGLWTVSDPPAAVHRALISSWELEPDPASRWALPIERPVHVWEIHHPADWTRLVATYPAAGGSYDGWELPGVNQHRGHVEALLAVEGQHGVRISGRQLVPDWAAVAADYDGVHLSWAGFLTAEGYVSDLAGGDVTMLRYWFSERTLWLRDAFGDPIPLDAPSSGIPDVEIGVDVRHDATRRHQDLTVLRSQRGHPQA